MLLLPLLILAACLLLLQQLAAQSHLLHAHLRRWRLQMQRKQHSIKRLIQGKQQCVLARQYGCKGL
jgi:hypothetical protein